MKTEKLVVANISCGSCIKAIKPTLSDMEGVENVTVNQEEGLVTIH